MTLVLDASVLIDIERSNKETLLKLEELRKVHPGMLHISFPVYVEILRGIEEGSSKSKTAKREFLESIPVLSVTKETAKIIVKLLLKYKNKPIALFDLFTAAQAIENNFTVVTKDKDFEQIEGLDKAIIRSGKKA
jgi:predicted nucleic acid-binding protein